MYNLPFTLSELNESLQKSHDTEAGSDEIHCHILKHLPNSSFQTAFDIFTLIWRNEILQKCWTEAIINKWNFTKMLD